MGKGIFVRLPGALAALVLLVVPGMGLVSSPQASEPEAVEQLDPVEVTAVRIPYPERPIPLFLPDVSTAVAPLPEGTQVRVESDRPAKSLPNPGRLLLDETAKLNGGRTRVRYLESARPPYPRRAREMGWQGTVVLRVEVNPDGTVEEVSVRRTSGYPSLDEAALTAVKEWRFAPLTDGAFSMSAVVDVPVRFDLRDMAANERGS
jgi:protein TonB